ncbi:MAG TPA: hypothetical protein VKT27_14815 [Candidatus Binataceae bacterium]|nr:hypothetical protein [Candidatus Binataceae bacterium]
MMRREKLSFIGSLTGMVAMAAFLGSAIVGCSSAPDNSRNPYSGTSASPDNSSSSQSPDRPYTR